MILIWYFTCCSVTKISNSKYQYHIKAWYDTDMIFFYDIYQKISEKKYQYHIKCWYDIDIDIFFFIIINKYQQKWKYDINPISSLIWYWYWYKKCKFFYQISNYDLILIFFFYQYQQHIKNSYQVNRPGVEREKFVLPFLTVFTIISLHKIWQVLPDGKSYYASF